MGEGVRAQLIAAAVEAYNETGGRPMPDLSAAEVFEASGVSSSTFYEIWPTFDDYRRDVLVRLIDELPAPPMRERVELMADAIVEGPAAMWRALETCALAVFDGLTANGAAWVWAAYPHRGEVPRVAASIRRKLTGMAYEYANLFALVMAAGGRRPVEGVTVDDIARALVTSWLGWTLHDRLRPGSAMEPVKMPTPWGTLEEWSRVAATTAGICFGLTEART